MSEVVLYLQGNKSELNVYENRVIIINRDYKNQHGNSYSCLNIRDIKKVSIIPAEKTNGYIKFSMRNELNECGYQEVEREYFFEYKNLNAKQQNLNAFEIKVFIEEKIIKNMAKNRLIDILSIESLKKCKELLDSGIITQEEFEIKKKQILGL